MIVSFLKCKMILKSLNLEISLKFMIKALTIKFNCAILTTYKNKKGKNKMYKLKYNNQSFDFNSLAEALEYARLNQISNYRLVRL